jgi:hypothetical protein
MTIFDILLNLIETVTELNGLEYTEGEYDTYFKPCYTANIKCLEGVDTLTVKIPTFFQACRYNNIDHVTEATFLALNKKYIAAVAGNVPAKTVKSDMQKLMTICKSDISLVLWLDFVISCNLYNKDKSYGSNNPIERPMIKVTDDPFTNEIIFNLVHDHIEYALSRITLNRALDAYNHTNDEKEREKIMVTRMLHDYPCTIYWYERTFLNAATASNIHNIRNWSYLKDDDTFNIILKNIENDDMFKSVYNDKFNCYDKMCEEAFEVIVNTILEMSIPSGRKWNTRNSDNIQQEVSPNWVHEECSDYINKELCSAIESTRATLIYNNNKETCE